MKIVIERNQKVLVRGGLTAREIEWQGCKEAHTRLRQRGYIEAANTVSISKRSGSSLVHILYFQQFGDCTLRRPATF
ncbi:H/ACA ribonucleoprotein complex non-core subunit NAF1 [Fusarium oxysporum f. sp. albedinis]|nr:H/ACA ribonucleoprotein complex non-core subunit NAF1 [Fusarium oxysporum f. sp. albedinis]